jgi:hypothetical protein
MWESVLGILICGALFALYGLVRQKGCNGHCAGCLGASCGREERPHYHD